MIRLEANQAHLLLFVPFSENGRAKAIEGRRWDPATKGWLYPKTARAHDAIIAEFGDDLVTSVERPADPSHGPAMARIEERVATDVLVRENEALRKDIRGLRESVERVVASTKQDEGRAELQGALLAREAEIAQLREQLADARSDAQRLEVARYRIERDLTECRIQQTRAVVVAQPSRNENCFNADGLRSVRNMVLGAVGPKSPLVVQLDDVQLGAHLATDVGRLLERELRTRLGTYEGQDLHDLINQAHDTEIITSEGRDFAHGIRRQRNVVVHDKVARQTFELRGALALVSAGLLWPALD